MGKWKRKIKLKGVATFKDVEQSHTSEAIFIQWKRQKWLNFDELEKNPS